MCNTSGSELMLPMGLLWGLLIRALVPTNTDRGVEELMIRSCYLASHHPRNITSTVEGWMTAVCVPYVFCPHLNSFFRA